MEIMSHGIWAVVAAKALPAKVQPVASGQAFLWGMFPDLFAFTLPVLWILGKVIFGDIPLQNLPHPHGVYSGDPLTASIMLFADTLYQLSHSLVVFVAIFLLGRLVFRKYQWALVGWGLHIVMDIPTHARAFYPTEFLWPISVWTFDGISWATPWFMIVNYSTLLVILCILRKRESNYSLAKKNELTSC